MRNTNINAICTSNILNFIGETFIDMRKYLISENINLASVENQNELNIIKRISPKKGRALVFNGNRYHSSSGPTKDIRCIINFDITIKK